MHSNIEKRLLDISDELSVEFVQNAISEFEQIDDDLTFDIPKAICEKTKANFIGKRTLPLILGGDKVSHNEETPVQQDQGTKQIQIIKESHPLIIPQTQNMPQRHQLLTQQVQLPKSSQLTQLPQLAQLSQITQVPQLAHIPPLTQIPELTQITQVPQFQQPSQLMQLQQILETSSLQVENTQDNEESKPTDTVIDDIPEYTNMSI